MDRNRIQRVLVTLAGALIGASSSVSGGQKPSDTRDAIMRAHDQYASAPLRFEAAEPKDNADFVARAERYQVRLAKGNATIVDGQKAINLELAGAVAKSIPAVRNPQPGVKNPAAGSDPRLTKTGAQTYGTVEYKDVYPGVNVIYSGTQRRLQYDFIVAPGGNYKDITLDFKKARRVWRDGSGNLVIETGAGKIVQRAPRIYQDTPQGRQIIPGGYLRKGTNQFGFTIGPHDPKLPLVIDRP